MMRTAVFSTALIFGGLRRLRFGAVHFGIGAFREEARRGFMHPRCHAIGCRTDLPITNDCAVKCRLLGSAAVGDPGSDTARWWLVLSPTADCRLVEVPHDALLSHQGSRTRHPD